MLPQAPNSVSLNQTNVELGKSPTAAISMNDTNVRALTGNTANLSITDMYNLRGKSAYTAMTVTGYDVAYTDTASGVQYTGSWYPQVAVASGGSGGFTYLWTFISNAGGFVLAVNNAAQGRVTHSVTKYGWSGSCVMNCAVSDNTGHTVNKTVYVDVNITDGLPP